MAWDAAGYRSLTQVDSAARLTTARTKPCIALDTLAAHPVGFECLTGCRWGLVPVAVLRGDMSGATAHVGRLWWAACGRSSGPRTSGWR